MTQTLPGADIRGYYAALGVTLPARATDNANVRCFTDPIAHRHGDRNPSCSVNLTTGAYNCHGCGAKGGAFDAATAHRYSDRAAIDLMVTHGITQHHAYRQSSTSPRRRADHQPMKSLPAQPTTRPVLTVSETDVTRWQTTLDHQPRILQRLARERAWSASTIRAFELGIDANHITIPVRDAQHNLVGLLRYRPWDSGHSGPKMLAAPGSRRQLLPHPAAEACPQVLLVEGEPDMLAARSLGIPAIALPGVDAWRPEWADLFAGRRIAIIMDADDQGRVAARRIAADLRLSAETTIVDISPKRGDGYDLTEWILDGHADPGGSDLADLSYGWLAHGR